MALKNETMESKSPVEEIEESSNTVGPEVSLRILVPASRTGSIIGKRGVFVQSLRQSSGAKIKIANTMPGCEERAVHISSPNDEDALVPAQLALQKLLERIFADEVDNEGSTAKVSVRMLVDNSQVGPILGKGGNTINKMRENSGANIKVIQGASDLPVFRGLTDELVQITGDFEKVILAVNEVSQCLRENPPRTRPGMSAPGSFPRPMGSMAMLFPVPPGLTGVIQSTSGFLFSFNGLVESQYRLLVSDNKVGCVIGKGGDVIRQIREETKARVIVFNPTEGCEERIVMCRSMDEAPTLICSAQEALCRCLYSLIMEEDRNSGGQHTIQLLVQQDQVGAVLGKRGSIIKEIQMHTGAKLVVQNEGLPSCANEDDEILEIRGRAQSVMQAIQTCCCLMRVNMARSQAKEASAAMGATPLHENLNSSHRNVEMLHQMNALVGNVGMVQRTGMPVGYGSPHMMAHTYLPPPPPPQRGNLVAMNGSTTIQNTNQPQQAVMKLGLSSAQAGAVIGTGGQNISQIRQISGARVKLHGKDENGNDRVLEITGSSEQCQAAQNLVQAFLLAGGAPPKVKVITA
eukprot:g8484.t1